MMEVWMDADDLAVFAAAAQTGGITRAAETLHTVQSNVTQRIHRLEAELGVPLFHRHSRGVTLTSAGAQLLPYAERIGHLIREAKLAAVDSTVARGRIVIGALESATAVRLPPVLAAYGAACPEVDIEIDTGTTAGLVDAVLARRLEAAFVAGAVTHPDLLVIPVTQEELVLVTAPWLAGLDELAAVANADPLKLIVFRSGCTYRTRLEALLSEHGISNARRLEFGTLDGIIGCVGAGIGVTLLPRIVVAKAESEGRVALHKLPSEAARIETVLIRRHDIFVSTALGRFIEISRKHLSGASAARNGQRRAPQSSAFRAGKK
jgi:DNA-binding transcriptional LysR family regulator